VLLHVPKERIYANNLLFKESGEFAGFDASEPTSRSGGKAKVIETIKEVTFSTTSFPPLYVSNSLRRLYLRWFLDDQERSPVSHLESWLL
jgi:hypothetical protein